MADKLKKEKIALTIYYYAYDAAGNCTDVVLNGVLDTHYDFDAANQVLGMTMGSEVAEGGVAIVADDAIVGGGMIVAVDSDVAQELANVIGTDCRAKNGSAPDYVVVDGQSYMPVLPPFSSLTPATASPRPTWAVEGARR